MSDPNYQDVLLRLLSMWDQHVAKLQGRRPRTLRRRPAYSAGGTQKADTNASPALTKSEYLRQRVARAVEPLEPLLHESDVRYIKLMLEERLRTDPYLLPIVERVTRRFQ